MYIRKEVIIILHKEKSTKDIFEEFYGKPMEEITIEDLGDGGEIDWGEDIGGEIWLFEKDDRILKRLVYASLFWKEFLWDIK